MRSSALAIAVLAAALLTGRAAHAQSAAAPNACVSCHARLADPRLAGPAAAFASTDIHRESGFSCIDCHGGNPSASDKTRSHDARDFKGKPAGTAIIATCARCHTDAAFMRKFAPRQRIDQAAEYATSVHGKRLAAGDGRVATCVSCHGAHGMRLVNDAKSPVFATNVAATCAGCHADPSHMTGYTLPNGKPLPTNQLRDYQQSVHHAAMTKGNDLSAPTCNDCHGNHGAAPPGAGTVVNVCGTCHAVFAQKFATSVHSQIFDNACVECHGNHAVRKPSDEMLGTDAGSLCGMCHSGAPGGDDKGAAAASQMRAQIDRFKAALDHSSTTVTGLKNAGMEMSAQELGIVSARTRLTVARAEVHTFDAGKVGSVVTDGMKALAELDAAGDRATAELRFRRRGLAVSLCAILLVVIALGLKIRQLDRRG